MDYQDSGEKARREVLRKSVLPHHETVVHYQTESIVRRKLAGIITELGPLSERKGLVKFLKNVDHASTLNGFVQDLACAVTDYQVCIANPNPTARSG